ncbi:YndM family protein [Halobacillus sp. H74]|uniref:YndM family protein n=1 Tax=Halobacillus sp. H74 TaxID=3457436 RepID=UPI003FCD4B46
MEHGKALLVKGVLTLVALYLVLGVGYGASFVGVLLITLVLGLVSYFSGDLFILPKTNNLTATSADLVLTFLVVWAAVSWFISVDGSAVIAALISAVLIAIAEYGFHIYLASHILPKNNRVRSYAH